MAAGPANRRYPEEVQDRQAAPSQRLRASRQSRLPALRRFLEAIIYIPSIHEEVPGTVSQGCITHRAHILEVNGEGYCLRQGRQPLRARRFRLARAARPASSIRKYEL